MQKTEKTIYKKFRNFNLFINPEGDLKISKFYSEKFLQKNHSDFFFIIDHKILLVEKYFL